MFVKKIAALLCVSVLILLTFTVGLDYYNELYKGLEDEDFDYYSVVFKEYRDPLEVLTPIEMEEDLNQLKKDLEDIHPKTINGLSLPMAEAFKEAYKLALTPMTVQDFTLMTAKIVRMLNDSQTYIDTYSVDARKIPLAIKKHNDQFFVINGKGLKPKEEVLSIGNIPMIELYDFYRSIIPADNEYWYTHLFEEEIVYQDVLSFAGCDMKNDVVPLKIRTRTGIRETEMRFGEVTFSEVQIDTDVKYQTYPAKSYGMPFRYRIDEVENVCHFVLLECENSPDFRTFLSIMFKEMQEKEIHHLIIDLRQNSGGDETASAEIIKYLPIDYYKDYGYVRRLSKQSSEQKAYKRTYGTLKKEVESTVNQRVESLAFMGDVYVLIDSGTSAEANRLGVLLKDNHLATIVGVPSGHPPSGYGDVLYRQLPNSHLIYFVSYTQFIRPSTAERFNNALYPDLLIQNDIEDYISGFDKSLDFVINHIKKKQ